MALAVVAYKVQLNSKAGNVTVLFKGGNVIPTHPTLPPVSYSMTIRGSNVERRVFKDSNIPQIM